MVLQFKRKLGRDGFSQCRKYVVKRWSIECDYWENFLVTNDYEFALEQFVEQKQSGFNVKLFEREYLKGKKVCERCLRK